MAREWRGEAHGNLRLFLKLFLTSRTWHCFLKKLP